MLGLVKEKDSSSLDYNWRFLSFLIPLIMSFFTIIIVRFLDSFKIFYGNFFPRYLWPQNLYFERQLHLAGVDPTLATSFLATNVISCGIFLAWFTFRLACEVFSPRKIPSFGIIISLLFCSSCALLASLLPFKDVHTWYELGYYKNMSINSINSVCNIAAFFIFLAEFLAAIVSLGLLSGRKNK